LENDSRRLNLGSKCADKSTLVQHKTSWQYWCICTVGCTCTALYMEKLKVSILFGKGNRGWKFPRACLILYCLGLGGLKGTTWSLSIENSIVFQMRPSWAFSVYCKLCHVQAELSVWRKIGKVESFRGWNFRGRPIR
jgi:hypothetical protein